MSRPAVSLVIRCFNEEQHIGRLLAGIQEQTVRDLQVVVVDSGSTDRTLEVASRFPVEVAHIAPTAFSFGRALNLGFANAKAEIVVAASAHVYPVYRDWIEQLVRPFHEPGVALVYGKQRGAPSSRFSEHQVFRRWFPDESDLNQGHPFCNNANVAIRRGVWEHLPYDETLTGLEDLDWAKRAMALGHRIAYQADAEVVHVHEESARQILNRYRREAIALKHVYPVERFGILDFVRLCAANIAADIKHAFRAQRMPGVLTDIITFRTMQFWGTYRGFHQHGPITTRLKQRFYYPDQPKPAAGPTAMDREAIEYAPHPSRATAITGPHADATLPLDTDSRTRATDI